MVAVPLIFGRLTADDYSDAVAADPRIDALRGRMQVSENPQFTADYFDPDKRYIGNSVQVFFTDGTATEKVRSEEHTSELQSLMRISYAVFCLKKKTTNKQNSDIQTMTKNPTMITKTLKNMEQKNRPYYPVLSR